MGLETVTEYYVSCDGPGCDNADGSLRQTKGVAIECARSIGFIRRRDGRWYCDDCAEAKNWAPPPSEGGGRG